MGMILHRYICRVASTNLLIDFIGRTIRCQLGKYLRELQYQAFNPWLLQNQ